LKVVEDWSVSPGREGFEKADNPSSHLVKIALSGYSQLAADTILRRENRGKLSSIIRDCIETLDISFTQNYESREKCARVLVEVSLNLIGMEGKRVDFSEDDLEKSLDAITAILKKWEKLERGKAENIAVKKVIGNILGEMKMVLNRKSMVAKIAEEIEMKLDNNDICGSFLLASRDIIQNNVYYQIVSRGMSKFGNDSATGLRWVRHLGAVQVSSNPVIAARAFDEIPSLWKSFENVVRNHPEWQSDPKAFEDEIALFGTITSLLPNVLDFRPLALLSDFKDGMVSIQLNPFKAKDIEGSIQDALKIYSILEDILHSYDFDLTLGESGNRPTTSASRPNVVFKVSTGAIEAIRLTEELDRMGLGTNNTVTFTVSQEIRILMSVIRGLVGAQKAGMLVSRVYITNMEGRLEDHLREKLAKELMLASFEKVEDKEEKIRSIATKLGAIDVEIRKESRALADRVELLCSKRYLKSLTDEWFVETVGQEKFSSLNRAESDIRMSGIFVTRRVFEFGFSPSVRSKWIEYVMNEFDLPSDKANQIIDTIDLLPSSKRREQDTYLVLGNEKIHNLTNTEFPDQQAKVWLKAHEESFRLYEFENSISSEPDPSILNRLLQLEDFRKAYELTPELANELKQIGIPVLNNLGGIRPEDWHLYGPVEKTMDEFKGAYLRFRTDLVEAVVKSV
jgi:transaldolase